MASRLKRLLLLAGVAGAAALAPALAQEVILPPGFGNEPTPAPQTNNQAPSSSNAPATSTPSASDTGSDEGGDLVESDALTTEELPAPLPPVEMPQASRRDPNLVGALDPVRWGYGAEPWGSADGAFLSGLMRHQSTPLPSRWLQISLRNLLLARAAAPANVYGADWAAERAWLLLRMGEADAARMVVSGVDVADYSPKLTQVAVQSALANADPAALCPLRDKLGTADGRIAPLVQAMCASLEGEGANASSQIEQARRRGRIGGIDLTLADKVVGAGENTGRAATVEWEPVQGLTSWRFGLAAATGMLPPERLLNATSPQVRAWGARAPLLAPDARLPLARTAAGLGVFSSAALVDLYSQVYDTTDPSDLPGTDAFKLRTAFIGKTVDARMDAMRALWKVGEGELEQSASHALLALAATRITPSTKLQKDAPDLIASMLAGGYDSQAARWAPVLGSMDNGPADRAWAMLALGTEGRGIDLSASRIESFIDRDDSRDKSRSKLLVAGLAGTGKINGETVSQLNDRYQLGLGGSSVWTRLVDGAGQRRQAGSALLLAAIGLQSPSFTRVPAGQLFHSLTALRMAGLGYQARMIAAEALART